MVKHSINSAYQEKPRYFYSNSWTLWKYPIFFFLTALRIMFILWENNLRFRGGRARMCVCTQTYIYTCIHTHTYIHVDFLCMQNPRRMLPVFSFEYRRQPRCQLLRQFSTIIFKCVSKIWETFPHALFPLKKIHLKHLMS